MSSLSRRSMPVLVALAVLGLQLGACGSSSSTPAGTDAGIDGGHDGPWAPPSCSMVAGNPAVTFTSDDGATLAPAPPISGLVYTAGLVTLDTPNALLAASGRAILRSDDAGCSWTTLELLEADIMVLIKAGGDVAYGFADNGDELVRVEGTTVEFLEAPTGGLVGLGVDPDDGDHVRIGVDVGQIYDSTDGGRSWEPIGVPVPGANALGYRVAFDAHDIDHILHGNGTIGVSVSDDGGKSWTSATGMASDASGATAYSIVVSPIDGQLVWAEGMDLGPGERRIYRSTDGGHTFSPVLTQSADVVLTNGTLLVPHPTDEDVLYFEYGTYFENYGTDIYRYDHGSMQVSTTHNDLDDVSAIAFNPADPSILYLGRSAQDIQ